MWLVGNIQDAFPLSSVISAAVRNIDITSNDERNRRETIKMLHWHKVIVKTRKHYNFLFLFLCRISKWRALINRSLINSCWSHLRQVWTGATACCHVSLFPGSVPARTNTDKHPTRVAPVDEKLQSQLTRIKKLVLQVDQNTSVWSDMTMSSWATC